MNGSGIIVIEHMGDVSFTKFARAFLLDNGFSNIISVLRTTGLGVDFIAEKAGKKYLAWIISKESVPDKSQVMAFLDLRKYFFADSVIIFSRKELSKEIRKTVTESSGELITRLEIDEWINSKFTSLLDFLDYLELKEVRKPGKYSNKELIRKYQELKQTLGKQPSIKNISKYMDVSEGIYSQRWGTYRNFIASIDDKPVIRFSRPNKSLLASVIDLIEDYIRLRKKLKRIPSNLEIENKGKFTQEYYANFFGSISNFVMVVEREIDKARMYKKSDLIREYRAIQKIVKHIPTFNDIHKKSKISPIIYLYHWGTWDEFMDYIGEEKQYRSINEKELVQAYFDLEKRLNKTPSQLDLIHFCGISYGAFEYRFGSWTNFVALLKHPEFVDQTPGEVQLLTDYYKIKQILNKPDISQSDIKKHTQYDIKDYINHFGSFRKFMVIIDDIEKRSELITEDELIHEYLRLLSDLNKTSLTIYDVKDNSVYSYADYLAKFKTWVNVHEILKNYVGKISHTKIFSNQQLIDDYHRVEKLLNKSPLFITDYKKYGKFSEATFLLRFGSWKAFLHSIGQKSLLEITNEEIIEDYHRVKKLLDRKVFRRDYAKHGKYSDTLIRHRYGRWSDFLKSINEDTSHIKDISRATLVEDYQRVKKLLGKSKVSQPDMGRHGKYAMKTYSTYFGGWDKFLEYMGEDTSKHIYTDQEMIDEYFRVKNMLRKEHIAMKDMNEHSFFCGSNYRLRFGSWVKFLNMIGEDTEWARPITDDDLKAEYLRVKKELNKPKLILDDIKAYGKYKSKAYFNHFGSWDNFVRIMGDGNSRNFFTDQEVIDEYWRVKELLGKDFITRTDIDLHAKMSSSLISWRFGSWKEFLKLIGEENRRKKPIVVKSEME